MARKRVLALNVMLKLIGFYFREEIKVAQAKADFFIFKVSKTLIMALDSPVSQNCGIRLQSRQEAIIVYPWRVCSRWWCRHRSYSSNIVVIK